MSRPGDDEGAGGFLSRWSRRKQAARDARLAPDDAASPPPAAEPAPAAQSPDELPLPSLDDITPGADVKAFFAPHVPEALRKAALRKLWTTDPIIKDFIEIAENQYDFANPDSIPGWSSTLPELDVQRILGRMLAGASQPQDEEANGAPGATAAAAEPDAAPGSAETGSKIDLTPASSTFVQHVSEADGRAVPSDVAAQNTQAESEVSALPRRRHGGALPA